MPGNPDYPDALVERVARAICCPDGTCRAQLRSAREPGKTAVPCMSLWEKEEAKAALSVAGPEIERLLIEDMRRPSREVKLAACRSYGVDPNAPIDDALSVLEAHKVAESFEAFDAMLTAFAKQRGIAND